MNTGKQINAMVVVLFLTLIAVGIYAIWDPFRAESKEDDQLELTVERAARTFTQNCRLCHGDAGQGGAGNSGRLSGAAQLDRPELRGIASGSFDLATFKKEFKLVSDTIMCGRVGSQMPVWGATEGGTLNEEQIRQLAVLITGGDPNLDIYHEDGFWAKVQEHADEIDAETTHHATLQMPDGTLDASATEIYVSDAGPFARGQYIRIRNEGEGAGEERMRVLPLALRVDRGVDGTDAARHEVGAAVLDENGDPILDRHGENAQALVEAMDNETTLVVVGDTTVFRPGDVIQVDDERMEVTELADGLPTTGLQVVHEIGREPRTILISGSNGLEAGQTIRIDSEILRIVNISDAGDPGIRLTASAAAGDDIVQVSDPAFFGENYVIRVGDELMRVIQQVDTGQQLGETIGRANTVFDISGTDGVVPDEIIRMSTELMRVIEILQPASITISERGATVEGVDPTPPAASHAAGTEIFAIVQPSTPGGPVTYEPTGVVIDQSVGPDVTTFQLNSIGRLTAGDTYRIGDEFFTVGNVVPARVKVERGYDGTDVIAHGRRLPIYAGNSIEVERGYDGTTAAAHESGDDLFMTEIRVEREQEGSKVLDHAKNAEIFLGNSLIVERGVKQSQAAEHPNGQLVLDFPPAPDGPPVLEQSCGQFVTGAGGNTRPTPIAGATEISIDLSEFVVDATPPSTTAGLLDFIIANVGGAQHNLRVIKTDLPADQLPTANGAVDEAQLDVLGSSQTIGAGQFTDVVASLDAGRYVLICNFPGHYLNGMHTEFEVTP